MTDQELRALVRQAIAVHLGSSTPAEERSVAPMVARQHVSHSLFVLPTGADAGGPCLIEPTVMCNHCGYCKSLGH